MRVVTDFKGESTRTIFAGYLIPETELFVFVSEYWIYLLEGVSQTDLTNIQKIVIEFMDSVYIDMDSVSIVGQLDIEIAIKHRLSAWNKVKLTRDLTPDEHKAIRVYLLTPASFFPRQDEDEKLRWIRWFLQVVYNSQGKSEEAEVA